MSAWKEHQWAVWAECMPRVPARAVAGGQGGGDLRRVPCEFLLGCRLYRVHGVRGWEIHQQPEGVSGVHRAPQ